MQAVTIPEKFPVGSFRQYWLEAGSPYVTKTNKQKGRCLKASTFFILQTELQLAQYVHRSVRFSPWTGRSAVCTESLLYPNGLEPQFFCR